MSGKPRSTVMYGISRIDDPTHRTHAWRVSLRRRGKALVKNFPDKKYGGKRKALESAKQHRDSLKEKFPPLQRIEFANVRRKNNKSGVTGVCLIACKYYLADGTERKLWYWEAHWPTTPGNYVSRRFSVAKLGEGRAFEMACRARRKGLREVEGVFWAAERGGMADMAMRPLRRGAAKPVPKPAAKSAKKSVSKTASKSASKTAARKSARRPAKATRARRSTR